MKALLLFALAPLCLAQANYPVAGTVVHAVTGEPLARARVNLRASRGRDLLQSVTTGANGAFAFAPVAAGKYTLEAERNGFPLQPFNQRRLYLNYASAVVTGPGENTSGLVFRLQPGSVIAGTILDSSGDPVAYARVDVYRISGTGENRVGTRARTSTADDTGRYRVPHLAAGQYVVAASGRPWFPTIQMGDAAVEAAYPVTFYPSALSASSAGIVEIGVGQEARADVVLTAVPAIPVSVKMPSGLNSPWAAFDGPTVFGATTETVVRQYVRGETGMFMIPAGHYVVMAVAGSTAVKAVREADVNQPGQQIDLSTPNLAVVRGVVRLTEGSPRPPGQPLIALVDASTKQGYPRLPDANGGFQIDDVRPGLYRPLYGTEGSFVVRAISAKGATLRDGLLQVKDMAQIELSLLIDTNVAAVEGRLVANGHGVPGRWVVAVPKGRLAETWNIRLDQTDTDGSFVWRGLAPGGHHVFVLDEGDPDEILSAKFLEAHLAESQLITISGTGPQKVEIQAPKPHSVP